MIGRYLATAGLGAVVLSASAACAQSERAFDLPAGPLAESLNRYAVQADRQLVFSSAEMTGLQAPALRGRFTASAALDRLLAGTSFSAAETRPGVVVIRRVEPADAEIVTLEEVVVTGSLLRSSGDPASPVVVLDRRELDRRARATVAEVLTDLPQNYAGAATPIVQLSLSDRQGSNAVASTGVNLRGLGPSSTLLLVNGRRVAGTGFRAEFGDVSALPSAAVERVDVLLDGASALYGSDAVAGVVNVIMRRAFDGHQSSLRVSAARGGAEDWTASHILGGRWASGAAYLAYETQRTNAFSARDRDYTADGDLRPFGGTDRREIFSSPGNIVTFDPAAGAFVTRFAIRPGPSGTAQVPGDFVAGTANRRGLSTGVDLLPELDRHSLFGRITQSVTDRLELSGDLRFSRRDYDLRGPANIGLLSVTRANPFFVSPDGAPAQLIAYAFADDLGPTRQGGRSRSLGVSLGFDYDLTPEWRLNVYGAAAEERGDSETTNRVHTRFLAEALGTLPDDPSTSFVAARDGFFNPYGSGGANSPAVLDFISQGFSRSRDRSRARSLNALIEGPVMTLPAGDLRLAVGAQFRRESFVTETTVFSSTPAPVSLPVPERDRSISALFGELRLPLVGPDQARTGLQRLDLSVAARIERYSDFGTTTNPKVGLIWSPARDLTLRASWGTAFRAAALPQVFDVQAGSASFLTRADGSSVLALYLTGGNPDLAPERAETLTFGGEYRVPGGLRAELGLFQTRFSDRIAQPVAENLAGALRDPALTPFVRLIDPRANPADLTTVRGFLDRPNFPPSDRFAPTAYGAIIDGRWINTGEVTVRGLDLALRRPFERGDHRLSLEGSASYILDYDTQATPTAPVRSTVGVIGFPARLKSRLGAVWNSGPWQATGFWNHVRRYEDRFGTRIDGFDTVDATLRWTAAEGALSGLDLTLGVLNLFDRDPPFVDGVNGFGFDPGQASPLGRVVSLQLTRRW